jgi:PAS domain S-box-containing protein
MSRRISLDIENELSQRELQLLVHASKGLTDQAIANELAISLATIATYWGRIRIKLGPLNRTELVARYLEYKSSEEITTLQNETQLLKEQLEIKSDGDSTLFLAFNKFPDSILIIDERGEIQYVNEEFCRQMRFEPSEFQGQSILNFYPEGRMERFQSYMKGIFADPPDLEVTQNRTVYMRRSDDSLVEFMCNSSAYDTPDGKQIVICGRLQT